MSSMTVIAISILVASASATTLQLRRHSDHAISSMVSTSYGTVFDVETTIGGQTFQLMVDSGSSDTYVMKSDFQCFDRESGLQQPREDCLYDVNRAYNISDTYEQIPGQIFGIQYGDGIASGVMAFEEVTVAGIKIQRQRVGIADKSTPMGDGVNSGLIGLGYPALTSAHPANITDNSTYWFNRLPYKPILWEMYDQGLIEEPYFAHAIARSPLNQSSTSFGGYLSFGELPPVNHDNNWATVPVEIMNNIPLNFTSYKRTRSYWATTIPSAGWGQSGNDSEPFQAFFDSGNFLSFIPGRIADPVNKLFDPPAVYNKELAAYVVDCAASPPDSFTLEIGGQIFTHHPADLIYQTGEGFCISGISKSDDVKVGGTLQLNIIGVPFLKSVVSVFDFGGNEMRFARLLVEVRNDTGSTDSSGDQESKDTDYIPANGSVSFGLRWPSPVFIIIVICSALGFLL
ncbi:aspartic peptidase domain-containing protein [Aspergillus karnatakaensis]|uniref:pepsin-like aspartic protease n=1 Tax=Aspergillus karnatakaensis TaxID=1810916 RepID=UPI003CCD862E